jgi:hypothetical protein
VLLGVTVLGEKFGVATGAGFALIVAGCFLATRKGKAPAPARDRDRSSAEETIAALECVPPAVNTDL